MTALTIANDILLLIFVLLDQSNKDANVQIRICSIWLVGPVRSAQVGSFAEDRSCLCTSVLAGSKFCYGTPAAQKNCDMRMAQSHPYIPSLFNHEWYLSAFFPSHRRPNHLAHCLSSSKMTIALESPPSRDLHSLPDFNALPLPASPLLYLPPLLSSLPEHISPGPLSEKHENPPLRTATRLPDIDPTSLSLHKALHQFKPVTADYATVPYTEAFNWSELRLSMEEEREWYCVVFRSKRKKESESLSLYEADKLAHEEAVQNGGLILYWYGIPNPESGMNLATCVWQSRKHATAANSRPHHIKAMKLAANAYEIYALERYRLRKVSGELGVTIELYEGGEVGW